MDVCFGPTKKPSTRIYTFSLSYSKRRNGVTSSSTFFCIFQGNQEAAGGTSEVLIGQTHSVFILRSESEVPQQIIKMSGIDCAGPVKHEEVIQNTYHKYIYFCHTFSVQFISQRSNQPKSQIKPPRMSWDPHKNHSPYKSPITLPIFQKKNTYTPEN